MKYISLMLSLFWLTGLCVAAENNPWWGKIELQYSKGFHGKPFQGKILQSQFFSDDESDGTLSPQSLAPSTVAPSSGTEDNSEGSPTLNTESAPFTLEEPAEVVSESPDPQTQQVYLKRLIHGDLRFPHQLAFVVENLSDEVQTFNILFFDGRKKIFPIPSTSSVVQSKGFRRYYDELRFSVEPFSCNEFFIHLPFYRSLVNLPYSKAPFIIEFQRPTVSHVYEFHAWRWITFFDYNLNIWNSAPEVINLGSITLEKLSK